MVRRCRLLNTYTSWENSITGERTRLGQRFLAIADFSLNSCSPSSQSAMEEKIVPA